MPQGTYTLAKLNDDQSRAFISHCENLGNCECQVSEDGNHVTISGPSAEMRVVSALHDLATTRQAREEIKTPLDETRQTMQE